MKSFALSSDEYSTFYCSDSSVHFFYFIFFPLLLLFSSFSLTTIWFSYLCFFFAGVCVSRIHGIVAQFFFHFFNWIHNFPLSFLSKSQFRLMNKSNWWYFIVIQTERIPVPYIGVANFSKLYRTTILNSSEYIGNRSRFPHLATMLICPKVRYSIKKREMEINQISE